MAQFNSDTRGGVDDRVRITLGSHDTQIVESYTVRQSFLTQPSHWSLRLGHGGVVAELLRRFPAGTPYKLYIGSVLQQSGLLEDRDASGGNDGATVTFGGRDALAPLLGCADADHCFTDESYAGLVRSVLDTVLGAGKYKLVFSNRENRNTQAATDLPEFGQPIDPQGVATGAAKVRPVRVKAGDSWYVALRSQLDRAGLFLWAGADGSFVLSAPNTQQKPLARIIHRKDYSNVIDFHFRDHTSTRYSRVVAHARGGGGKQGRQLTEGRYLDQEMVDAGFDRPLVIRDPKSSTPGQAEAIARRKIAESRRASWELAYTVRGHTTPRIDGADRVVWAVDALVEVDSEILDLHGVYWAEAVEFSRGPESKTRISFMRPEDLVFGGEDE